MEKKIVIGCDHAAVDLKNQIIDHVKKNGYEVIDVGTYTSDSCNYPDIAQAACQKIQSGEVSLGILICGTGIGMSMSANKMHGIRAACCSDVFSATATRSHNDANVLCFGARVVGFGVAATLVDAFLSTEYEGGRHQTRIDMMMALEGK